jgi:hypothetical protein
VAQCRQAAYLRFRHEPAAGLNPGHLDPAEDAQADQGQEWNRNQDDQTSRNCHSLPLSAGL